jgi:hypothetical protein
LQRSHFRFSNISKTDFEYRKYHHHHQKIDFFDSVHNAVITCMTYWTPKYFKFEQKNYRLQTYLKSLISNEIIVYHTKPKDVQVLEIIIKCDKLRLEASFKIQPEKRHILDRGSLDRISLDRIS